ncbi:hypothetical protein CLOP_g13838 [Closterium sp. NIES-67]|nr:hypothetical protein CLOP_g13838 [Closterium sp. NIES-67]
MAASVSLSLGSVSIVPFSGRSTASNRFPLPPPFSGRTTASNRFPPPPLFTRRSAVSSRSTWPLPRGLCLRPRGVRLRAQPDSSDDSGGANAHRVFPHSPSASSSPSPPPSPSPSPAPPPSSPTPLPQSPPPSPPPLPSFQDGITWFCLSLIGLIALIDLSPLGPILRSAPPQSVPALLALVQWLFFVLPALSWCRDRGFPLRATLKLQLPPGEGGDGEGEGLAGNGSWWKAVAAGAVGGPILWALLFSLVSLKAGAGGDGTLELAEIAAATAGGDSVSAAGLLLGPVLLPDGAGGSLTATAATAVSALPLLDVLQLFLWVAVSPAVAEELLFRGLLLTALQDRLGRIDAAMLSAALFALFHLSLSLFFPNMALGIAAGLLAVYSNSVLPAVALHTTYNASALLYALMATAAASV